MRVSILGPVSIEAGGESVDVAPRLSRLLTALLIADGQTVDAGRLIDAIWGPEAPLAAETSLKTYVSRLRQLFAGEVEIVYRHSGYAIELGSVEVDRDLFEAEVELARQSLRIGDVDRARDTIALALGRWRGAPLGGVGDEDWARPEAVRLDERYITARAIAVDVMLADGRFDDAVAESRRLVEEQPFADRPRALLMTALYRAGRQAEALREYQRYLQVLGETGLDAPSELVDLESRIVTGRLEADAATHARGYTIAERIGDGAFSVVHRGIQPGVDREVAIKIIRAELADRPDFIRRFEFEAQTIARLEHPFVVPLYDFWREPGAAFLVMRLMRGGSVEQAIRARGPFSIDDTIGLLESVGSALSASHRAGVVHRDVRPANLLLDDDGSVYLADFGIAAVDDADDGPHVVAPAYAAPEMLRGEHVDASADVLSLGVTVFELLTGRLPFADSDDRDELIRRQMVEPLPPVRSTRPDLSEAVDVALARATAKAVGDRHATVAAFVAEVVAALGRDTTSAIAIRARGVTAAPNPYVGLHAFDEADSGRFFGRERLIGTLVESVGRHRMVTVVGASGSGKSSAVRAGLVPAIRAGAVPGSENWFISVMFPGTDPVAAFEAALVRVAVDPPASLARQLDEDGGLLRAVRRVMPTDTQLLVVIDQFEEMFTQVDEPLRRRFLDELAAAIEAPGSPLRVVATLRADFFDAPLQHPGFAALLDASNVAVRPLDAHELERVITGPVERAGVDVEPQLVAELVAAGNDRSGSLPLLQFALTELYERRVDGRMTLTAYREFGGIASAVAMRADRLIETGGPDDVGAARRLFGRLVTLNEAGEPTRRRAKRSEFAGDERTDALLDSFVAARLLGTDLDVATREPTVEVAHEALLSDWPRLRRWLQEDRDDLRIHRSVTSSANAWDGADRDPADLGRGARLEVAADLRDRRAEWLSPVETAWIEASIHAAEARDLERERQVERERHQNRRLRGLLAGVAVLACVAVAAAVIGWVQRDRAVDSEHAAEVDRLVADSAALIEDQPDLAVLLALEAHRRDPSPSTATAVQRTISAEPRIVAFAGTGLGSATDVAYSADGTTAVMWGQTFDQQEIRFVSMPGVETIGEPIDVGEGILDVAVSGDGSRAAVARFDRTIAVYDREGLVAELDVTEGCDCVSLNRDGSRIGVIENDNARVIDVDTGATLFDVVPDAGAVQWLAVSPDGTIAALALVQDGEGPEAPPSTQIVVHSDTGEVLAEHEPLEIQVDDIAVNDDGRVAAGGDGALAWDALGDGSVAWASGEAVVSSVAVAPDGTWAVAFDDGLVHLLAPDGSPRGEAVDVAGPAASVEMGGDGSRVIIVREDGTSVVIDPDASEPVADRLAFDGLVDVQPGLSHVVEVAEDATGYRLRDYADGSTFVYVDLTDIFPGGLIVPVGFWAPDGSYAAWWGSLDPEVYEAVGFGIVSADGSTRHVLDTDDVLDALGADGRSGSVAVRAGASGERMFVLAANEGDFRAGWLSTETGDVVAGPMSLETGGEAFVLDDGRVIAGGPEGLLQILDAGLEEEPIFVEDGTGYKALDVSNDIALVASGDGFVAQLDLDSLEMTSIGRITGTPGKGAYSPDGSLAAVTSREGGVQVFDLGARSPLGGTRFTHVEPIGIPHVRWADDSRSFWIAGTGEVISADIDPDQWVEQACSIVPRSMTVQEWQLYVDPTSEPVDACEGFR